MCFQELGLLGQGPDTIFCDADRTDFDGAGAGPARRRPAGSVRTDVPPPVRGRLDTTRCRTVPNPASLPLKPRPRAVRELRHVVAMIRRDDTFLMVKRPLGGLWGGLWEFPNEAYVKVRDRWAQLGNVLSRFGIAGVDRDKPIGVVAHRLTHLAFLFDLFLVDHERPLDAVSDRARTRWVKATRPKQVPMSTACRKMLRAATS